MRWAWVAGLATLMTWLSYLTYEVLWHKELLQRIVNLLEKGL